MGAIVAGIISGVTANCITGLAKYLSGSKEVSSTGKPMELQALIKRATENVAEETEWEPPPRLEEVCLFLTSPEVEGIVRQLLSSKLVEDWRQENLELIRKEFLTCFAMWVDEEVEQIIGGANKLFQALAETCDKELSNAINSGVLSAHEAKSAARYHILRDELLAIEKNLAFLSSQKIINVKKTLEFEEKYRQQVSNRHWYIIPPNFDVARKVPIDDLYIVPNFMTRPSRKDEKTETIKGDHFLSNSYRSVIIGNPGSGKSTFAAKLCHDLSQGKDERAFCGRRVTPILVVLRDYGAEKKEHGRSILQFIEVTASSKYQIEAPPGAFEYLLLNGRALVIFDGLDELLDTGYRQEISSDIESFCTLYPSVPVLVTSRVVGYEQAPLDERRFEVVYLAEFNEEQVKEYARKWFAMDTDLLTTKRDMKVASFLSESEIVPDLRSNPLMLALICNIYRGENYIPRNQPDVYEKCAMMLFERWDMGRGIRVTLPFEAHIRPAMMYLAHWIYGDERLQGGVTEGELVSEAAKYLLKRRFEDIDEAKMAATEFIRFCRGRAWVFTDTGTTRTGERLYQFTHRTFLEYFTAFHLVRIHSRPDDLITVLLPKITRREWDGVAQLSFQILNKNVDGAVDELLGILLERADDEAQDTIIKWRLLSFAARSLEFIVPGPKTTRNITSACVKYDVNRGANELVGKKEEEGDQRHQWEERGQGLVESLFSSAAEIMGTVESEFGKVLVEIVNGDCEEKSMVALEIGLFTGLLSFKKNRAIGERVEEHIYNSCRAAIEKYRVKYYPICFHSLVRGDVNIRDIVRWYSVKQIFADVDLAGYPNRGFASICELLKIDLLRIEVGKLGVFETLNANKRLKELGDVLVSIKPPWADWKRGGGMLSLSLILREQKPDTSNLEQVQLGEDRIFGGFVILAIELEGKQIEKARIETYLEAVKKAGGGVMSRLDLTFRSRFLQANAEEVRAEIENCGFAPEEKDLVWRWSQKEVDFVQRRKAPEKG